MSYNFTNGSDIIGNSIISGNNTVYTLTIDNQLIISLLIIIMLCNIVSTSLLTLMYIRSLR